MFSFFFTRYNLFNVSLKRNPKRFQVWSQEENLPFSFHAKKNTKNWFLTLVILRNESEGNTNKDIDMNKNKG